MAFTKSLTTFPCMVIMITLALLEASHAQNSPQDYLDAHNAARATVGVGDMEWSDEVAAYAEQYANQRIDDCAGLHSVGGPYGENLAIGSDDSLDVAAAVKMWVDEGSNYDYDSNSCADGQICGHYTQVVWSNSIRLGCARVVCNTGGTFITCNYDPRGNVVGERPY